MATPIRSARHLPLVLILNFKEETAMNTFNILKVCVVCAIGISAASCNNSFMDRYPIAEISPENSFKSAQDLELYTNGFYENLPKINDIVRGDNI